MTRVVPSSVSLPEENDGDLAVDPATAERMAVLLEGGIQASERAAALDEIAASDAALGAFADSVSILGDGLGSHRRLPGYGMPMILRPDGFYGSGF